MGVSSYPPASNSWRARHPHPSPPLKGEGIGSGLSNYQKKLLMHRAAGPFQETRQADKGHARMFAEARGAGGNGGDA
ncbi:hypothetical protein GCM10007913_43230 [Devosia yakushimensis]|uniref:Uncharacterized protein n=1 Tax=Devosia yakushimensis TaxID=470028 RepID=A0ABQ5UJX4_9HYPH|nr:hypothetical protein GCM10007913_43230 [Devosia yakushimensis]